MARTARPGFPLQDRHRAVAEIDAMIAQAEAACADHRRDVERSEAAGRDGRVVKARLKIAEERLAQLQRSRRVLVEDNEGHG